MCNGLPCCPALLVNPSPDSSTSFVMEKLQDLCTAVRGFDTWDLEQAILNLGGRGAPHPGDVPGSLCGSMHQKKWVLPCCHDRG